jgi:serine/threonine protein kinase
VSVTRAADQAVPGLRLPRQVAHYRLTGSIGQGSNAAVFLAQDERLHRQVALKVLVPELARDAAFRARMIRESQAAAAVGHPHIIPVYEAGEADGIVYVAMRYIRGEDARSLLNRLGPLPFGYAWNIVAQIASALDAAHARGLIHGDVRPGKILLEASDTAGEVTPQRAGDSESGHAYLSDFGMSRAFPPGQIVATGQSTGAFDYTAPEQIEGHALDGRADLYSLACTGFELLCGTPPFGQDQGPTLMYAQLYAPPPAATVSRADLPAAVDLVLATALNKNPADRYPSCGQFADELRAALGFSPGEPGEPAGPPPSRSPGRPGPVAESGLAAAEALAAAEPAAAAEPSAAAEPPAAAEAPASGSGPLDPEAMDEPNEPEREPSASRSRVPRLILAAAAVVVAAAVASGLALSKQSTPARPAVAPIAASLRATPSRSPSPSPASTSTLASEQAAALSMLLTSSAAARTALHDAVRQVGACTNLSNAVSRLQGVVNQRVGEYSRASALPTSALPDGAAMKSELIRALSSSLEADRDYLTWARQQLAGGCTPSDQSSVYNVANGASQVADAAKKAFVQVWNPVAAKYGIKPDSASSI